MLLQSFLLETASRAVNSSYEICIELEIINISSYKISFLLLFDWIRIFFFRTVCLIAGGIFLFRSSYMRNDKFSNRFLRVVLIFGFSIGLLVFSPNLVRILLGWDGLGVTSYLLVCYYRREKRFNARILTALSNRLGDVVLLLLIAINLNPAIINFGLFSYSNLDTIFFLSLVLVASITKRAQIPFSAWLPAAIAAPTPVSALVHSSTLVTAGVYLLIRFNFILFNANIAAITLWVGCLTILIAGARALLELDIKKIIALSTLSQLGVMVFTLGLGEIFLRWFHLIRHAYFKAIIFIGAGAIIHRVRGYQDIRKIGSLNRNNFLISRVFLTGSLSLCGMPFLTGFYSKDAILEQFLINSFRIWTLRVVFLATMLTSAYSIRVILILFTFFSSRERLRLEGDSVNRMSAGILTLFIPAVTGGIVLSCWSQSSSLVELPFWIKVSVIIGVVLTALLAILRGVKYLPRNYFISGIHQIWFIPNLASPFLSLIILSNAKKIKKIQEDTWVLWGAGGWINIIILPENIGALLNAKLLNSILIVGILILIF